MSKLSGDGDGDGHEGPLRRLRPDVHAQVEVEQVVLPLPRRGGQASHPEVFDPARLQEQAEAGSQHRVKKNQEIQERAQEMAYNIFDMSDSDLINHLFKLADPAKADLAVENARLKAENQRLLSRLVRLEREKVSLQQLVEAIEEEVYD